MFEPRCDPNIKKGGKQKEAVLRTISVMTGISNLGQNRSRMCFRGYQNGWFSLCFREKIE
jgi:hypothetical protein